MTFLHLLLLLDLPFNLFPVDENVGTYCHAREWYVPHRIVRCVDGSVRGTIAPLAVDWCHQDQVEDNSPNKANKPTQPGTFSKQLKHAGSFLLQRHTLTLLKKAFHPQTDRRARGWWSDQCSPWPASSGGSPSSSPFSPSLAAFWWGARLHPATPS